MEREGLLHASGRGQGLEEGEWLYGVFFVTPMGDRSGGRGCLPSGIRECRNIRGLGGRGGSVGSSRRLNEMCAGMGERLCSIELIWSFRKWEE